LAAQQAEEEGWITSPDATTTPKTTPSLPMLSPAQRRQRQLEFDKLAYQIEQWAKQQLAEDDGWTEVECNKMFRPTLNPLGHTRAWIKWMKDSRTSLPTASAAQAPQQQSSSSSSSTKPGNKNHRMDNREYPCIKVYSTIDAPLEDVCLYLSQEEHMEEYNDLIMAHKDVEEIAPHAKICWSQTPQILFVKPREFITFCHHKWLRDGTQLVVNQAYDPPVASSSSGSGSGSSGSGSGSSSSTSESLSEPYAALSKSHLPRAYALRGANWIGRDPEDPARKTRITILAHANPGQDVPVWAMKTAINALAPIEPFRLFAKINDAVHKAANTASWRALRQSVEERTTATTTMTVIGGESSSSSSATNSAPSASSSVPSDSSTTTDQPQKTILYPPGRSMRPAGIAQMGYACFWPNGGGLLEGGGGAAWWSSSNSIPSTKSVPSPGPEEAEGRMNQREESAPPVPSELLSQPHQLGESEQQQETQSLAALQPVAVFP